MSSIMRRRRGLNSAIGGLPSGDADAHNRHHHRPETSTVIAAQIPRQRVRSILLKRALSFVIIPTPIAKERWESLRGEQSIKRPCEQISNRKTTMDSQNGEILACYIKVNCIAFRARQNFYRKAHAIVGRTILFF